MTATCLILPVAPGCWPVAATQALAGAAHSVLAPAVAAITLGFAALGTLILWSMMPETSLAR